MAIVPADWSVDRATGNIRYIGDDHGGASPSYSTVLQLHRWLAGLADDAEYTGDDEVDIISTIPSGRSTDNFITLQGSYNIDDAAAEHLYDGSIVQGSGASQTIYDGIVNFGVAAVQIQIIQDGAVLSDDWWNFGGAGLNADSDQGISHRFMLKTRDYGVDIDGRRIIGTSRTFGNIYSEFKINGTARGNNVLALTESDDLNNETAAGTVATWTTITNTEGLRLLDVDNDGSDEEYYSEWDRDTYTINQFYERMKWLTRDASSSTLNGLNGELFRGITHSFAYDGETGGAPATNDEYAWGTEIAYDAESGGPFQVGEAIHEVSTGDSPAWKGRILALDDNGTTGTLIVDVETGTVLDNQDFEGQTSGAAGFVSGTPTAVTGGGVIRFFAVDDDGSTGNLYGQLMKGTAPSNNTRLYDDADAGKFLDVNGAVTERTISTPFVGASTGSAIIGAYGLGIEPLDLSASDKVFDLTNTQRVPPNNQTFTVGGLVIGEDYVFVGPWDGSSTDADGNPAVDVDQLALNTTLNGASETSVVVTTTIPTDTPTTGTIRVQTDSGAYQLCAYTSYTGSTFTITAEDFSGDNATSGNNVFISYLDKLAASTSEAFTGVYSSDRNLVAKVRDGGATPIKEYIISATFGSTGGSLTAIRTSDA